MLRNLLGHSYSLVIAKLHTNYDMGAGGCVLGALNKCSPLTMSWIHLRNLL